WSSVVLCRVQVRRPMNTDEAPTPATSPDATATSALSWTIRSAIPAAYRAVPATSTALGPHRSASRPMNTDVVPASAIAVYERPKLTRWSCRSKYRGCTVFDSHMPAKNTKVYATTRRAPGTGRPRPAGVAGDGIMGSEEHTSELQSRENLVCRLLLEKKKK